MRERAGAAVAESRQAANSAASSAGKKARGGTVGVVARESSRANAAGSRSNDASASGEPRISRSKRRRATSSAVMRTPSASTPGRDGAHRRHRIARAHRRRHAPLVVGELHARLRRRCTLRAAARHLGGEQRARRASSTVPSMRSSVTPRRFGQRGTPPRACATPARAPRRRGCRAAARAPTAASAGRLSLPPEMWISITLPRSSRREIVGGIEPEVLRHRVDVVQIEQQVAAARGARSPEEARLVERIAERRSRRRCSRRRRRRPRAASACRRRRTTRAASRGHRQRQRQRHRQPVDGRWRRDDRCTSESRTPRDRRARARASAATARVDGGGAAERQADPVRDEEAPRRASWRRSGGGSRWARAARRGACATASRARPPSSRRRG